MEHQPRSKLEDVMFWNHRNTVDELDELDMYANGINKDTAITPKYGSPCLFVLRNMLGACFLEAKAKSDLEPWIIDKFAAEKAEVKTTAFITCGNPFIPALLMAITKGEPAALPVGDTISEFFEESTNVKTNTVKKYKVKTRTTKVWLVLSIWNTSGSVLNPLNYTHEFVLQL